MKYELHIHSTFSDGSLKPVQILKYAKKLGLNGIAITDHNSIKGALEAQKLNQDPAFEVIIGEEIATDNGDIIGLFLKEEIICRNAMEVIDNIHQQGGLAVLPHPFRGHELTEEIIEKVDIIEVENSRTPAEKDVKARELAEKTGKPMIAGSDAHFKNEIGRAITMVNGPLRQKIEANETNLSCIRTPYYQIELTMVVINWRRRRYFKAFWHLLKTTRFLLRRDK